MNKINYKNKMYKNKVKIQKYQKNHKIYRNNNNKFQRNH